MQYLILKFFENTRNPLFDILANLASAAVEVNCVLILLVVLFLCVDKKLGYMAGISAFFSLTCTNLIKTMVRVPRPFMVHKDLHPIRLSTATGYSFPSGHSTSAACFYPILGRVFRNRVVMVIFALFPILAGVSRNYLGVHWPMDVAVGLIIGYTFSVLLFPFFSRLYDDEEKCVRMFLISSAVGLILCIILGIMYHRTGDRIAYRDSLISATTLFANSLGLAIERKRIHFKIAKALWKKILNALLCVLMMLVLSHIDFPESMQAIGTVIEYSAIMFWISCIYPYIAVRIGLLDREER